MIFTERELRAIYAAVKRQEEAYYNLSAGDIWEWDEMARARIEELQELERKISGELVKK